MIILDGTNGATFPSWTTGTRPASPNAGQTGYNTSISSLESYNGSTWSALTSNVTNFKNRLINGLVAVDQRNAGASQTFTAGAALAYSVDRWYGYCTGANVTGQRIAGTFASSQYRYQFTGAASVTAIGFGQRIEAANSFDLANTTTTLSCYISNSLLTTVTWTAYYANTTDTFGSLASPTRTQIATGTFTVTSTRTQYTASITVPSAATTGIEIVFSVGAQTSGTWVVDSIQLEKNAMATSFDYRSYGTELGLCYRYAYKAGAVSGSGSYVSFFTSQNDSVNRATGVFTLPTPMRGSISLTTTGTATDYALYSGGAILVCSAVPGVGFNVASYCQQAVNFTATGLLVLGQGSIAISNNTSGYLLFTAEL